MRREAFINGLALTICLAPGFALASSSETSEEHFGTFPDELRGKFIHDAKPRPTFKLENDFRFIDPNGLLWTTPIDTEVDGASIPPSLWSIIGAPFEGAYINASVIHDYYCDVKKRTAHDTHRNFYYGMRAAQVPEWQATLMYWAVTTFGPSWKLEKRITLQSECTTDGNSIVCDTHPVTTETLVEVPPVDLSDPEILAAAISKTNAVARSLVTSNGRILDVTVSGQVAANFAEIESSAKLYRDIFVKKELFSSPARLGLLSQQPSAGISNIQPWDGNRIPAYSDAAILTPATAEMIKDSAPFKIDPRSEGLIQKRVDFKALGTSLELENR